MEALQLHETEVESVGIQKSFLMYNHVNTLWIHCISIGT